MTVFSAIYASILNPCQDGIVQTYATTTQVEKKTFPIKIQNKNKEIGTQVTVILEIKLQEYSFCQSTTIFQQLCVVFEPLLGWEYA